MFQCLGSFLSVAIPIFIVELRRRRRDKIPVLLLTDIGRDIDDTLALISIAGYSDYIQLVGVIATGGNGRARANLARAWLDKLNLGHVKVCKCLADGKGEIVFPPFLNHVSSPRNETDTRTLISDLLRKHSHSLRIVAISPLSPLLPLVKEENTLNLLRTNTHSIWIQGQIVEHRNSLILPDVQNAYNLRVDEDASRQVFEKLQHDVPFRLLGKHAAYQVSLTPQDFASFDMIFPHMSNMAKNFLLPFRNRRPELFRKLYGSLNNTSSDDNWLENLNALSHPYDAALIVALVHDCVLRKVRFSTRHKYIGNSADTVLTKDHADLVHKELIRTIKKGLTKFM